MPVALVVNTRGRLVALVTGDAASQAGEVRLGERLLRLVEVMDMSLSPDLAYGRELALRVVRAAATADPGDHTRVTPRAGELTGLLAAAPTLPGREWLDERGLAAAWHEVATAIGEGLRASDDPEQFWQRHGVDSEVGRLYFHLAEQAGNEVYPFALLVTVGRGRGSHGRVLHAPLLDAVTEAADAGQRERMIAPLMRAAARSPTIQALVDSREVFHAVAWTASEAHALLQAVPELEACGIRVRVPDWWRAQKSQFQVRAQLGDVAPSTLGLDALLDFKPKFFLGDEELTLDEWRRLTRASGGLHRLKNRWVELDPEKHAEALRLWDSIELAAKRGRVSFAEGMRLLAGLPRESLGEVASAGWTVVRPGPWLARTLEDLQSPSGGVETDPGPALHGELRPYQKEGVGWLWLLLRLGLGGCLADDMGLGKTIQVIALLLLLRKHKVEGPHLIVLPASLLGNWRAELARFGPEIRVFVAHRSAGEIDAAPDLEEVDVVLTTYATLLRLEWIRAQAWGLVVLDEAQAIKNADTKQTRAVKALSSRHRLILTGTPVENTLVDLWSLFDFASPGLLGGSGEFKGFARRLGGEAAGLEPLRRLVRPYILRRLKSDRRVIADLPDKSEMKVYCGLTRAQAGLYAATVEALAREAESTDGIQRRGIILAYLTRFKQICNHPSHYTGDGQYVPKDSAKFLRLQELCAPISEAGERVLVFTQFREMCGPLATLLTACFGRAGLVLHGGTPVGKRAELVAQFQADDGPPFMVLSLKAGGTGLNLTAAAHVVHFDRWWNPAVENQATDRAYRIGQHKNVLVHKFVCRGTLEERIDAMITSKQGLAEGVLADDGERRLTELGTDELLRVVALDLRAALSED
jgi:hypothetical protein